MASKSFVIDRTKWLRGDEMDSCLLSTEGKMCCLGFYTKSCGVKNEDILHIPFPNRIDKNLLFKLPKWLSSFTNPDLTNVININDSPDYSDEEREKGITSIFNRHHIKVRFIK